MRTDRLASAVAAVLLLAGNAFAIGSHRGSDVTWSYVPSGPPINVNYSFTLDTENADHSVLEFNLQASTDVDLFCEYEVFVKGLLVQGFKTDFGRGEPYCNMWGWEKLRAFSGTYTDAYVEQKSLYVVNGIASWLAMGDVVYRVRFMLRYVNGDGVLVQSPWYRSSDAVIECVDDTDPPWVVDHGDLSAMNFSFGSARSIIMLSSLECSDPPLTSYNFGYMSRATSQLTGIARYSNAATSDAESQYTVITSGYGVVSNGMVSKLTSTIQDLVAAGDYLWDVQVRLCDPHGNISGWIDVGTVDLRDFD